MPLRRIDCADPALKKEHRKVLLPLSECLRCAASRNNGCSLKYSYEVLATMYGEVQDRGDNISTTAILGKCMRQRVLERKVDYALSPDDMWAAFKGTLTHAVLEKNKAPGCWGEVRLWARVPGLDGEWISCSPDLVDPEHGILFDYKTAKELPLYGHPWGDHEAQLQVNRWIIDHAEYVAETPPTYQSEDPRSWDWREKYPVPEEWTSLVIVYITDKTTAQYEVTKSIDVPNRTRPGTHRERVPDIWSDEQVEDYIVPRIEGLRRGLEEYPHWIPEIPEDLKEQGFRKFPCSHCPVQGECLRLMVEEGR